MIILVIFGCKKELTTEVEIISSNALISKFQESYNQELSKVDLKDSKLAFPVLGRAKIDWSEGIKFKAPNIYFISTNQKNNYFHKYLKVVTDKFDNIVSKSFLIIFFNKKSKLKSVDLVFNEDFLNNKITDFSGGVIEYDLFNKYLSSKTFINGTVENKYVNKIDYKLSTSAKDSNIINTNIVTCINWYWNTYVNGVLVESVYAFTTCNDNDASIDPEGGGSGGGGDGTDPCITTVALGEAFINAVQAVDGSSQILGSPPTDNDNWTVPYNWSIFTAGTWGLVSYENATLNKVHYQNYSRWEFQSMSHISVQHTGANIGGTRTFTYINSNFNVTPTHQTIWNRIDFSVSSTAATIAGCSPLPTLTILYNANTIHYAP